MANPLNKVADYAQSLLSSQRSQQLQESFVNFLKSIGSDAPARPSGEIMGAPPPRPGTIEQLFPRRPPAPQSTLPPPDIAAPNPGGGMVPQSVLTKIQSRPPEVPAPQGVWDPAIEAVNRRSAEDAARVLRVEQELSNIAASAAAEREAARVAKDVPGYVDGLLSRLGLGRKAPSPPVKIAPPEGYDEALEAAKFREQQLLSRRTDNLRGQDKALNDFKRSLIAERNEKAALEYVNKANAMERQQRLSDQIKSGVEGLKTAGMMGGALGAAVTVPAAVAGMANTPSPMAPTRKEPLTTADLASMVPSIEATPDEQPPQAPAPQALAQQPSYMGQNPGTPAPPPPKSEAELLDEGLKFFGTDTRPEITPEQREKAKQDFEAQNKRNLDEARHPVVIVPGLTPEATKRVREIDRQFAKEKSDEQNRDGGMVEQRYLSGEDEGNRQFHSNIRLTFTPEEWEQYNEKKQKGLTPEDIEVGTVDGRSMWTQEIINQRQQKAPEAVLPSDNLAAVEQELTPEPVVKSKPKPLASASAYDDPTGTRFNQLIQSLAVKNGMTPEQARAIYQENTAKGLSPRQAMQPLIDMGQAAFMNRQEKLKGNVARGVALSPRNPRAATNALGELSQDERDYSIAMQTTGGKAGPSPREMAAQKQKTDAELLRADTEAKTVAEQARLERESNERRAGITAGGQVSAAWPAAISMLVSHGINYMSDRNKAAAAADNLDKTIAAERERQERALEAGRLPPPPTGEDDKKRAEAEVITQSAETARTASRLEKMDQLYHGVPGGTEAILANQFRTGAGQAALEALTAQARKASKAYYGHDVNSAAAMDEALKGMGMTDPMLRQKLVQEYTGVRPMRARTS